MLKYYTKLFSYCLLVVLVGSLSFSLPPQYKHYSKKDNLSHNQVYSACQDTDGFLWFGSNNTIDRFDGREFKAFRIKKNVYENRVLSILDDGKGNLWLGTETGVSIFRAGKFMHYTQKNGLVNNRVTCIVMAKNDIFWFGTVDGISRFNGSTFKNFQTRNEFSTNFITSLAIDSHGKLWIAQKGGGVSSLQNNHFEHYTTANGLPSNRVFCLYFDSKENLWAGTQKGVCYLRGEAFYTNALKPNLHDNKINAISEDDQGNIFIGTWQGVWRLSPDTDSQAPPNYSLSNSFVTSILKDREGNVWATSHRGVTCLKSLNRRTYSVTDGLVDNFVKDIMEDCRGDFWIGTVAGLNHYSQGKFKSYTQEDGLIDNHIFQILEDRRGNIWIATLGGLSLFSSGKFTNYTIKNGLPSNYVYALCEDMEGKLWVGTSKGVKTFQNSDLAPPPIAMPTISARRIFQDSQKNMWFASDSGAYKYNVSLDNLTHYSEANGLPINSINHIHENHSGQIFLSTDRGLSCITGDIIKNFSTEDELADNECRFVIQDHEDNLWIGTANGISCFDGQTFKTYNRKKNGLIAAYWNCGLKDSKGRLWFGSIHGINTFKPPLKSNPVPPPVHITSVKVMGDEVPLTDNHRFPYDRNNFRIDFTGLCFTAPQSVTYQYKLEGADKRWNATGERGVSYPNLPPGTYTFHVKAFNNDNVESLKPARFAFKVLPPFWQRWWFYILVLTAFVLFMFLLLRFYFKRIAEKKELKVRTQQLIMSQRMELVGILAAGAVHDMKNLMSIIIGISNIIGRDTHLEPKNQKLLGSIKDTADTAARMVKQILRFSRPKTDDNASQTRPNMEVMLDEIIGLLKVTTPQTIQLIWRPPDQEIISPVDPVRLQQIVMNLCLNALHAMPNGGTLEITLRHPQAQPVCLTVSDTGCGIEPAVIDKIFEPMFTTKQDGTGTGLGLFVVRQIIDQCNGTITVHSEPGKGTTFTIHFPA